MVITGANEIIGFGYESTFGTEATINKVFGFGQKVSANLKSDTKEIFGTTQRDAQEVITSKVNGEGDAEFILSDFAFLKGAFGNHSEVADSPSAGLYTHTFTIGALPSMTIGIYDDTMSNTRVLLGALFDSMDLTISKDEPTISVKLTIKYANETTGTALSEITPDNNPFNTAQSTLEIDSTAINFDKIDLTLNNNVEEWIPANQSAATDGVGKQASITGTLTIPYEDLTYVNYILNNTNKPFELTIDNGLSGTSQRQLKISGTIYFNENNRSGVTAEDLIFQEIPFILKDVTVQTIDATSLA